MATGTLGVQLLVEDVPGAKRWLCENLFFVEEEHKGMICLRNGNFRLVLREDREHLADNMGRMICVWDSDILRWRHMISRRRLHIAKAGIKSAARRKRRTAV